MESRLTEKTYLQVPISRWMKLESLFLQELDPITNLFHLERLLMAKIFYLVNTIQLDPMEEHYLTDLLLMVNPLNQELTFQLTKRVSLFHKD
jgi:hypothetical protein